MELKWENQLNITIECCMTQMHVILGFKMMNKKFKWNIMKCNVIAQ